jgi:SAM-dependent methyltransferase
LSCNEYNIIAKFYDSVIGQSNEFENYVKNIINKYNKNAKSILELGCGTGNNIKKLSTDFNVTGIDFSKHMLKIAKKKVPDGKFYLKDIRNLNLKIKFDVIICLYDTINHLRLFNDWKKLFDDVYKHLNENGLFIFDINTIYKLENISDISPVAHKFDSNYLIIDVRKISKNTFNWNLKVFENKNQNNFIMHEVNIKESSFEIEKNVTELSKYFIVKRIEDENKKKADTDTERVYFVCQKQIG